VRGEIVHHRPQHRRIAEARAQAVGREPGKRQQPRGAVFVGQDPAQRAERQRRGIGLPRFRLVNDLSPPFMARNIGRNSPG